ncbi:prealbumin-like fold domain-containing protein [uncultured Clostridium sp.]|uniref:prealbumin-like fold domain-containing protein n=1 Tax=uncultured Clostridium sp. TaxID=59620 RepID=UPI0026354E47|nr:prealbumin-like fold domain-containing protein [uncultured Clostridium sp.]
MRIRIDDDFDKDLEEEYKSIDNDTIVGNGALSNENIPIIDVKAEDLKEEALDNQGKKNVIKKEETNKYNLSNGFSIEIQGATLIDDNEVENYLNNKNLNSNNNLIEDKKDKVEKRNESKKIKESNEYIEKRVKGKIVVGVRLGDRKGKPISEAKVNLYALNGISPKLISSKLSDKNGIVVFDGLPEGSYRVIEIVNRRYFEKPTYIQWNEVTISKDLKEESIIVINRLKKYPK